MLDSLPAGRIRHQMPQDLELPVPAPVPDIIDPRLARLYDRFSLVVASLVMLISLAVLLSGIRPFWIAMKPNTAIGLGALGIALLLATRKEDQRRLQALALVGCAALAMTIGAASLLEDLIGVKFGIDQLLFHGVPDTVATSYPGRPGQLTSALLIPLGLALLATVAAKPRLGWLAGLCCLPTLFVSMSLIIAYALNASELYTLGGHARPTSFTAVVVILLLAAGIMCQNPQHPLYRRLASGGAGGIMSRNVLPLVVVMNTALVGLRLWTQDEGVFHTAEFGSAAVASLSSLSMIMIVMVYARRMDGMEMARRVAEARERDLNAILKQRLTDLEEANHELEEFSYSVSHDLRTPLRAIDGFSGILAEDYADKLDSEGQRVIGVVREGTRKMAELIDDILAFSRIGRAEMSTASVDMNELIEGLLPEFAGLMEGHDIRIAVASLLPVQGDRMMLRRVWQNLLDNAIEYTGAKASARIEVGCGRGAGELEYWIKDNGAGFDMRYADKLFGMFRRLHGADEFSGTGIGLAIVKRIITRHGGRVWAEGQPDLGATFHFALPVRSQEHV